MKRASAVVFAVLLGACASSAPQPLQGHYALAFRDPSRGYNYVPFDSRNLPFFAEALRSDLASRGATVDIVSGPDAPGYDGVILVSWSMALARTDDVAHPDASGGTISAQHTGTLQYQILQGGKKAGSGSVNMSMDIATESAARSNGVNAAHSLAADIAKKLARTTS
jgi:hypothetical protein